MPMVVGEASSGGDPQIRFRKPRNYSDPVSPKIPSIVQSARSKTTISSLLSTFTASDDSPAAARKKYFTSTKFRGLGCAAPAEVSVPAVIRTSASWEGKKVRKKKQKKGKNKKCVSSSYDGGGGGGETPVSPAPPETASSSACLVVPDVWCGPGIGFSTDAASDCVVSRRPVSGRGKVDGEKINIRERSSCGGRRMVHPEEMSFFDSESGVSHPRFDAFGSRHHRHVRHPSPEGLSEIVMLQGNVLMGGRLDHDRYRDWRLDVDGMSYEELLELGDKIGYVSTGLREDEIGRCVRKTKPQASSEDRSPSRVMQWKCTICQEEYEGDDEMGRLECGHFYHIFCIKQWLLHKKTCPVCKTSAVSPL